MPTETVPHTALEEPGPPSFTPARFERADNAAQSYRKVEADILALPEHEVGRVTADVAQAASIALGALPNLLKFREDFKQFAHWDDLNKRLDTLQDRALATFYAHVRSLPKTSEQEKQQLIERGKPIREKLLAVAQALVGFGLVDAGLVETIRAGQGNLDMAQDLVALATLFNSNWEQLENKVPVTRELVAEAGAIGANLLRATGVTGVGEARKDTSYDWPSLRARAFRLLLNDYDELRRAIVYLRWHEKDADAFAPSLHAGKKRRRSSNGDGDEDESSDLLPESDAPEFAAPGPNVAPGMPGESPFEN